MQEEHGGNVILGGVKCALFLLSLRVSTQLCSFGLFHEPNFDGPYSDLRTRGKSQFGYVTFLIVCLQMPPFHA